MGKIEKPSTAQVKTWMGKWKTKPKFLSYKIQEKILQNLFRAYPNNHNLSEVEVKAKTLNLYYSTNVKAITKMAEHIVKIKNLDELLAE